MHQRMVLQVILKIFFLTASISVCYTSASDLPPRPSGPVADYAGVLENATKLKINALARSLWVDNGFGLIVATVNETGDLSTERYAEELYRSWGAGVRTSPEDAIVLLSIKSSGVHIHVGAGARRYLSETPISQLLARHGKPHFVVGDYDRGLLDLTQHLAQTVQRRQIRRGTILQRVLPESMVAVSKQVRHNPRSIAVAAAGLAILFVLLIKGVILRRGRRFDYCGSAFGGGVDSSAFGGRINR